MPEIKRQTRAPVCLQAHTHTLHLSLQASDDMLAPYIYAPASMQPGHAGF